MSARSRRFFGCLLPLILAVFGCGSFLLLGYAGQIAFQVLPVRDRSMAPVLEPGWRIIVNNTAFWAREPELGSVLSVGGPRGQEFRRIYALPGQTIEGRDGEVLVNRVPSRVLSRSHGVMPDFGPVELGADQYYVLAEDRGFEDSRQWGPLSRDRLYGTAMLYMEPGSNAVNPVDPTPAPGLRPRRSTPP